MKKKNLLIGICIISLTVVLSGCVEVPETWTQMSITIFKAELAIITQGEMANLSWIVIGATSVSIDQGIGNVSLIGE